MKLNLIILTLSLSHSSFAEDNYIDKAKAIINKMASLKLEKEKQIMAAEQLSSRERACAIQDALKLYKDNYLKLSDDYKNLWLSNSQKVTAKEEGDLKFYKDSKLSDQHSPALEKASKEIDLSLCQLK